MFFRVARYLIAFLLVNAACRADEIILSRTDPTYAVIEKIQESLCESKRTLECRAFNAESCAKFVTGMEKFIGLPKPKGLDVNQLVDSGCGTRGTRYEFPGTRSLIYKTIDDVLSLSKKHGLEVSASIAASSLPLHDVNAETQIDIKNNVNILLVNIPLLDFANQMAKIVAYTIPTFKVKNGIRIPKDQASSVSLISSSPSLREHFIRMLHFFLGGKYVEGVDPPQELEEDLYAPYRDGVEFFAIAHELGHIYHRHPSSSFDVSSILKPYRGDKESIRLTPLALREIEADGFALKLLIKERLDKQQLSLSPENSLRLHAAEFLFLLKAITNEAESIEQGRDVAKVSDSEYSAEIASCIAEDTCEIASPSNEKWFQNSALYPSHSLRAAIVQDLEKRFPLSSNNHYVEIGDIVNRNIRILWELTKDDYTDFIVAEKIDEARSANDDAKMLVTLNALRNKYPGIKRVHAYRADLNLKLKNFPDAVEDLTKLLTFYSADSGQSKETVASILKNRATAYTGSGKRVEAVSDMEKVVELTPSDCKAYRGLGFLFKRVEDLSAALGAYNRAIFCDQKFQEAYVDRGYLKNIMRDYKGAVSDFSAALRLKNNDAKALNGRGFGYFKLMQDRLSLKDFNKATVLDKNYDAPYFNRALVLEKEKDYAGAIEEIRTALTLSPKNAAYLNHKCYLEAIIGRFSEASADCDQALNIRPDDAPTLDSRGFVELKLGKNESAINYFNAALKIDPKLSNSLFGRGVAKLRTGDPSGKSDLANALAIKPNIEREMREVGVKVDALQSE